jgi:hypothetical protein
MYRPAGLLCWQEKGQPAVIADPDGAPMVPTPVAAPDRSRARRQARLTLGEDGAIEGDMREEYSGHLAADFKEAYDNESAQEREESLTDEVRERFSTAELTNVGFENVTDAEKPLVRTFHVRVPSYGQLTGRWIFFQPSFFETRGKAVFPASTREHPIGMEFAWSEEDHVTVALPAGYELESGARQLGTGGRVQGLGPRRQRHAPVRSDVLLRRRGPCHVPARAVWCVEGILRPRALERRPHADPEAGCASAGQPAVTGGGRLPGLGQRPSRAETSSGKTENAS